MKINVILDMPRTKVGEFERKSTVKWKKWSKETMVLVLYKIRAKEIGVKRAVRKYGVPRLTLKRYLAKKDVPPEEIIETTIGRKTVFPRELELLLVDYLLVMEHRYFSFTRGDCHQFVFELAQKNCLDHPFNPDNEMALLTLMDQHPMDRDQAGSTVPGNWDGHRAVPQAWLSKQGTSTGRTAPVRGAGYAAPLQSAQ